MAKSKRYFVWDTWDYDCDGEAYIIAKDVCPNKEDVPDFICREDRIPAKSKSEMRVQDGWCPLGIAFRLEQRLWRSGRWVLYIRSKGSEGFPRLDCT